MKGGKAAGSSGIIAEMLEAAGEEGIELLRHLAETVFSSGEIPKDLEESIILNLYKDPYNYTQAPDNTDIMSDTTDKPSDPPSDPPTETQPTTAQQQVKPIKKVKSKKDLKDDPNRFESPGINFNAKLIGIDDVGNARGDKMCQEAMTRLKLAVRQSGQHKQKIIINVSYDGIRIMDLRTQATNHTHPVHRISFISRDITDARAFGYVYGAGEGKHKFFAIKTEKAAEALVLALRDLFQAVYEMKKKEVEEAKHKIEEPVENAKEVEETQEPVYQVPSSKPVEGQDSTYQVPSNNTPVQNETADLLNLENELHTMEERIEQIDTMEELFKELEAPPPASSGSTTNTAQTSWASSLGGLNISQAQPTFSMGGAPFPGQQQPFGAPNQGFGAPAQNQPFGMQAQPFGAPAPNQQQQPFGAPAPNQQQPFGAPAPNQQQPFGAPAPNQQQPFGFQQPAPGAQPAANPFGAPFGQAPNVPPRTGMAFPGQPGQPFPGTPFPGVQPQGFPPVGQPNVVVTPATNDPFGNDPFQAEASAFDDGVLMPARIEKPEEQVPSTKPQQIDVFGDLVSLGDKSKQAKTPKDMFTEAKPKKSLNEIKGSPSPKPPASPTGFQASGTPGELQIGYSSHDNVPSSTSTDPFGASPFGTEDPFANDPFASSTTYAKVQPKPAQPFGGSPFDEDDFNLPVPRGPPPPLPTDISAQNVTIDTPPVPAIPPRPTVTPPINTHAPPPVQATPPVPPRPKSNHSDSTSSLSSSNSFTESQIAPPNPPPRPISGGSIMSVPRPRPRPRTSVTQSGGKIKRDNNDNVTKSDSDSVSIGSDTSEDKRLSGSVSSVQNQRISHNDQKSHSALHTSCQNTHTNNVESHANTPNGDITSQRTSVTRTVSSGSSISDPFVNTDPFVSDDPFKHSDPFANDPFAADPFSEPAISTDSAPSDHVNDPFTCIVPSPQPASGEESDPFSVFDKTFPSDIFKFDRTSSKKNKLKVSGQ